MTFDEPLIPGRLIRRYKRFLADVRLEDGSTVTAHCANSGSMLTVDTPDAPVWLLPNRNPKAKLGYRWELIEINGALVGINTNRPNRIVEGAVAAGRIPDLQPDGRIRREVRYGNNSRIDLLVEGAQSTFIEIKNVTMSREQGLAEFPDAVTARGTKHLAELGDMAEQGHRAVMFYLVNRSDCTECTIAGDIDPAYAEGLHTAVKRGVEVLCYGCRVSTGGFEIADGLPFRLPSS